MKSVNTGKWLAAKFGGKWKFVDHEWQCDDGVRYVCSVLTGRDYEGEYTGETSRCMYYRDNSKPPEWIYGC